MMLKNKYRMFGRKTLMALAVLCLVPLISNAGSLRCPVPSSQIKAEWFKIEADKKSAHAYVRDGNILWTMNIVSKAYLLEPLIIQRTLDANYTVISSHSTLGCDRCFYRSSYQYPVEFGACGSKV